MKKQGRWPLTLTAVLTILSFYFLSPTIWELNNKDPDAQNPEWMPDTPMRLGLDLQGGIHMVLGVDLDKVVLAELQRTGTSLERSLRERNLQVTTKVLDRSFELEITASSPQDERAVADYIQREYTILQYVGSTGNIGVTRLSRQQESHVRDQAMVQSISTIRNRIDEFGVAEPTISRMGDSQMLVQFPGARDPERVKGLIGQTAQLVFQMVHECTDKMSGCLENQLADLENKISQVEEAGGYTRESFNTFSEYRSRINEDLREQLPPETTIAFERITDTTVVGRQVWRPYLLSTRDVLSGEYIQDARVTQDTGGAVFQQPRPVVSFEMDPEGTPLFRDLTGRSIGRYMAIVLDGIVKSAPVINSEIGGRGQITLGRASLEEAQKEANDTAIVLRAGALPTTIEMQEERVIGPSIGAAAIAAGKKSLVAAVLAMFALMILYYGQAGVIAALATAVNISMIFAILGLVGATLTLPGIAGIVLTIGMAVDAFIIIFERMRDEIRAGRTSRQVVEMSFNQAVRTILDSNITTAIGAYILLEFGTGSIRGFALTLLVGISTNVFIATFFTKAIFDVLVSNNNSKVNVGISKEPMPLKA